MHEFEILNCGTAAVEDNIIISVQSQKKYPWGFSKVLDNQRNYLSRAKQYQVPKQKGDSSSILCENKMITEKVE